MKYFSSVAGGVAEQVVLVSVVVTCWQEVISVFLFRFLFVEEGPMRMAARI